MKKSAKTQQGDKVVIEKKALRQLQTMANCLSAQIDYISGNGLKSNNIEDIKAYLES